MVQTFHLVQGELVFILPNSISGLRYYYCIKFVGAGNTFSVTGSRVDISIAGGGGGPEEKVLFLILMTYCICKQSTRNNFKYYFRIN